uniref:Uncharacterized protein n=1 Tax=viral metagenome TaxID=1070528 RepID=A0A6C0LX91_9ZZZZ
MAYYSHQKRGIPTAAVVGAVVVVVAIVVLLIVTKKKKTLTRESFTGTRTVTIGGEQVVFFPFKKRYPMTSSAQRVMFCPVTFIKHSGETVKGKTRFTFAALNVILEDKTITFPWIRSDLSTSKRNAALLSDDSTYTCMFGGGNVIVDDYGDLLIGSATAPFIQSITNILTGIDEYVGIKSDPNDGGINEVCAG